MTGRHAGQFAVAKFVLALSRRGVGSGTKGDKDDVAYGEVY